MQKVLILLLLTLALFSGCSTHKRVVVDKKSYPSWYENPPRSTADMMYEVGEGTTKQEAINNALSMMVSTLSVSIASKFQSNTVENQGVVENFQKTVSSEIKSDVKKIRISHYELLESEAFGFKKYLVLIRSDKNKVFESLKHELDQRFSIIEKHQATLLSENAIKQLSFYEQNKLSLADVPDTLTVMNVLNRAFDGSAYLNRLETINKRYSKLQSEISFSIKSNIQAKNLIAPIRNGLSIQHYNIENSKGKNHFNIIINASVEKADAYGFTLARSAIAINVKDYKGIIIGSNKLNIIGQSTQGYNIANENVAIKLNTMIEKEGIEKVLGLEL